MHEELWKCN